MKQHLGIAMIALFTALAAPAMAQDTRTQVQDAIIAQLSGQGFTHVRVSNTFLGRVRIFATSPDYTREIIFNPRTGEILRDYWDDEDDFGGGLVSPAGSDDTGRAAGDDDVRDDGVRDADRDDAKADDAKADEDKADEDKADEDKADEDKADEDKADDKGDDEGGDD